MKHRTEYQQAKANALQELREVARTVNTRHGETDKPMCRECINDTADAISKDLPHSLTDQQRDRITSALHSLAGRLHP